MTYIASRWYRAPELLFGSTDYDEKIDIWAAACVIAELLKLSPLFHGKSSRNQVMEILAVMGAPTDKDVRAMNKHYQHTDFPAVKALPFETNFPPMTNSDALDFLRYLLVYNPNKRPSAREALAHKFLKERT